MSHPDNAPTMPTMSSLPPPARARSGGHRARVTAITAALALVLVGCGGGETSDDATAGGWVEPDYAGEPADLTAEEVCDLLDEDTASSLLGAEVTEVRPGGSTVSCDWVYTVPEGPRTNMHVQVMTMSQTFHRIGTEALEWALDWAPSDVEISPIAGLDTPSGSYEFSGGLFMLTIDRAGRVVSVSCHPDTPESARAAILTELLDSLAAHHS